MKLIIVLLLNLLFFCNNVQAQGLKYYSGAEINNYEKISFTLFQQDEEKLYAYNYDKPITIWISLARKT
ncbi:MAG: hypothetical protein QM727_03370 [Niabella sp.]